MNTPNTQSNVSVKVSPASIGCLLLLVSFFLPWINILGIQFPGHKIPELSEKWQWLWAIPVVSGLGMLLGFAGKRHIEVAQAAGGLPLVALAIALYQNGQDLFKAVLFGGYMSLVCGIFLLCVAPRLGSKKVTAAAAAPVADNS